MFANHVFDLLYDEIRFFHYVGIMPSDVLNKKPLPDDSDVLNQTSF